MIKALVKKILKIGIEKSRLHLLIKELIEEDKISQCKKNVSGSNCVFHAGANVANLQYNNDSILIGDGSHIAGELLVLPYGGKITIGHHVYIGAGSRIWSGSEEGISIEDDVLISHNVTIIDSDSHEIDNIERMESHRKILKYGHPKQNPGVKVSPIKIKKHAWISYNCSILKGITIGEGSIIGAGSVVTKDIPDYVLAAGNPAKVIKSLKKENKI